RQQRPEPHRDARGGGILRAVADPRLLAMHLAWDRHAIRDEAGGPRDRERLLAAVPLRPDYAPARHESVPARFDAAAHPPRGVPLQRGAVHVAHPDAAERVTPQAQAGATRTG